MHNNMTVELPEPEAWIENNPSVVNLMTSNLVCLSCVTSSEVGIRILINGGFVSEWFRETFGTFAILYAWSIWIIGTTGSVNHILLDQFK